MEPQHYNTNYGAQQEVYGRKKSKKGCFIIALLIFLFIGGGSAYLVYYIYNKATSTFDDFSDKFKNLKDKNRFIGSRNEDKRFTGEFVDAVIVPQTGTTPKIFILVDGSKKYIETRKSPGHYSTGVACIDCKTTAYIYDPEANTIINTTDHKFPGVVTSTEIAYVNGKVYQFVNEYDVTPAGIFTYDAASGNMTGETADFINKYPELSGGLTKLSYWDKDGVVKMETTDGRKNVIFNVELEKVFTDEKTMKKMLESSDDGEGYLYGMNSEDNDSRFQLHKITAPLKRIKNEGRTLMSYAGRAGMLKMYDAKSEKVSDKNYIEGIIYAQDADYIFLVSLTQAGKKCDRIFTCVDAETGKEKWSIQQSDLFDYMKIDEEQNSQQSFSSTKDKISVQRLGSLVLLKLKGDGVMGFDANTGKKLWSIQPAPPDLL
jgi:hypothetical protein